MYKFKGTSPADRRAEYIGHTGGRSTIESVLRHILNCMAFDASQDPSDPGYDDAYRDEWEITNTETGKTFNFTAQDMEQQTLARMTAEARVILHGAPGRWPVDPRDATR